MKFEIKSQNKAVEKERKVEKRTKERKNKKKVSFT